MPRRARSAHVWRAGNFGAVIPPQPAPARTRRSWGQRALLTVLFGSVLALLAGGGVMFYAVWRLQQIDRLDVGGALLAPTAPTVLQADELEVRSLADDGAANRPDPNDRPAENYLIVGSDNGEELDADNLAAAGRETQDGNYLADTIMLVRVDPATGTAYLLSIPRDLDIEIAGTGEHQKVNSAFNLEDPVDRATRLIQTLQEGLDIGIQHYVEVDLAGFTEIVDTIGGVDVCFDQPTRDRKTGLFVASPGVHRLDGSTALAYVRSRSMEEQDESGDWVTVDPRADLDRIVRQQGFLKAAVEQSLDGILGDPVRLNRVLTVVSQSVKVSNTLNVVGDGLDLADLFRSFGSDELVTESLAVEEIGTSDFRLAMLPEAEIQLDVLRGVDPDDVVPGRVDLHVVSEDGSDVQAFVDAMASVGFDVDDDGDLDDLEAGAAGTEVLIGYGPGGGQAAELVAAFVDAPIRYAAAPSLPADAVTVVVPAAGAAVAPVAHHVDEAPEVAAPVTSTAATEDDGGDPTSTTTTVPPASVCDGD
jgi:LCP family protein required for cell wall assembly